MATREYYQKVAIQACMLCGDEIRFARTVGVPLERAIDWLLGASPIPGEYFAKMVDVVLASKARITGTRAFLARVRRRYAVRAPRPARK